LILPRANAPRAIAVTLAVLAGGCTANLLSGIPFPDRSRPVAMIETRGGVEFGATTDHGILFLGRTAQEGPCRVHFFVGQDVHVEDGTIEAAGGGFHRAVIDVQHQAVPLLARSLGPHDELMALTFDGSSVGEVAVRRATEEGIEGDLLVPPAERLAAGTGLFVRADPDDPIPGWRLAGLVAGEARLETGARTARYIVFSGPDRLRELQLVPMPYQDPPEIVFRPDGVSTVRAPRPSGR
jgi:hypothetical protein